MLIPVLAAGVVGACLGGTVMELRRRAGAPAVSLATSCAREAALVAECSQARGQVVESYDVACVLATLLDLAIRLRVSAEMRLVRTEDELGDALCELVRLRQAERGRVDVGAVA